MAIMITLILKNGTVHLCDETCYNATHDDCTCICDGLNHGEGLSAAERLTIINTGPITSVIQRAYPDFQELRIHFHNSAAPYRLNELEAHDRLHAALPHPLHHVHLDAMHPEPTLPQPDHLDKAHADLSKMFEAPRDEPNG